MPEAEKKEESAESLAEKKEQVGVTNIFIVRWRERETINMSKY